ncbi:AIPR family protein [Streptomyces libani]|uniref:AIPR family protein n=1 Tax=Streptomyces nigrescens TaxID=1920 RepID=UPI00381D4F0F
MDRLFRGLDFLLNLEFSRFNNRIERHVDALEKALDTGSPKVTLILALVTGTELHPDIQSLLNHEVGKRNWAEEMIDYKVVDLRGLYREILGEHADRSITLEVSLDGVGKETYPYTAYYGTASAAEIAEWYEVHERQLFTRNIRDVLDVSDVNNRIRATLLEQPEHFWYFSNGITLLCDRVRKKGKGAFVPGTGAGFVLEGASVVNGAQTVSAMHRAMQRNPVSTALGRVLVRIISLEDCPHGFGDQVTVSTNTQNPIEERDFKSRDPIQIGLRDDFALSLGRTYVIKRGEPDPDPGSGCSMTEAAVALAATHRSAELGALTKRDEAQLWDKENYRELFGKSPGGPLGAHRVWRCVELLRTVRVTLDHQRNNLFGRAASAAGHGDLLITHVVFRLLDTEGIDEENTDWAAQLSRVPELVVRALGWLVVTVDIRYGRKSHILTTSHTPERARLVARHILERMTSGDPAPDNADYRVDEPSNGRRTRSTSAVNVLVRARRIPDGPVLEFRPVTRMDRQHLPPWIATVPDRGRAVWRNDTARPLVWEADGEAYAASPLVRRMRGEAMDNHQQVQGTLYWHIPGEGSLYDIAKELRAEDELAAEEP